MIRKRRGTRRGPWRSPKKRRWIASLPCLITGRAAQCCHLFPNGMSSKCSDEFTVPLSPEMHDQFDSRVFLPNRRMGRTAFMAFYRIDLQEKAEQLHQQWLKLTGQEIPE